MYYSIRQSAALASATNETFSGLLERTLSALLIAISVALLTAGLFSYASVPLGDAQSTPLPTEIGNPVLGTGSVPAASASASPPVSPSGGGASPLRPPLAFGRCLANASHSC
jgi:hypothetical protein